MEKAMTRWLDEPFDSILLVVLSLGLLLWVTG
jgi:hypothetical protein